MEQWIEAWAKFCDLLPVEQVQAAESQTDVQRDVDDRTDDEIDDGQPDPDALRPAARPETQKEHGRRFGLRSFFPPDSRKAFFDAKVDKAQGHLDEMKRLLDGLGHKLDNAEFDEAVEVETVADSIEVLIFQYNDALESARDAWLRDNLPGDYLDRANSMLSPRSWGLPSFTDEGQAHRAKEQDQRISRRLGRHDAAMDRLVFAVQVVDTTATVVSIVAGGGVAVVLVKQGGKRAVKKMAASAIGAMAGETIAVAGMQYAGVSDQTIRGVQLAAAVVKLVLLRRNIPAPAAKLPAQSSPPKPTAPKPAPRAKVPPKPASPKKAPPRGKAGQPKAASTSSPSAARAGIATRIRVPAAHRGNWVKGKRGDGTFRYNNSPENQRAGVAGMEVRFENQHIAVGGFPPEAYWKGSAANASVKIKIVTATKADDRLANAAMRTKLGDSSWKQPDRYTWNHAGPPGSKVMELVETDVHGAVAHMGPGAIPRAAKRVVRASKPKTGVRSRRAMRNKKDPG